MKQTQPKRETGSPTHHLFFREMDIELKLNTGLNVEEAEKHPHNPLIPLGDLNSWDSGQARPWEGRSVIYDRAEGLFKAWYSGTDATPDRWWKTGYAHSEDGVHWEKPVLELFEFNGNTRNNICAEFFGPVIRDDQEPDETKRFKMFVKHSPNAEDNSTIAYSRDGIVWDRFEELNMSAFGGGKHDAVVFIRDDQDPDPARRFKTIWQYRHPADKPGPELVRAKAMAYGPTETEWHASPNNPILDPNDGLEQENHFLTYLPYEGQYLMFYEYGWYHPDGYGAFGTYTADIRLAHSHDGECFQRVRPDQKVIPRGSHGDWDDQFLVISDKGIIKDDKIYLYYCGQGEDWTSWPPQNKAEGFLYHTTGCMRLSRMGLATIEKDRFTSISSLDGETPGYADTPVIDVDHSVSVELHLNVSRTMPRRSWIEVEILGEVGNPIQGFSRSDCDGLTRDSIDARVTWKPNRRNCFDELGVDKIRLRFWIMGEAKLHSYWFA